MCAIAGIVKCDVRERAERSRLVRMPTSSSIAVRMGRGCGSMGRWGLRTDGWPSSTLPADINR